MNNKSAIRFWVRRSIGLVGVMLALAAGGCSINDAPRPRMGSYATATPGTTFLDLETLGTHQYYGGLSERNGIVYTCEGGHIDIAHLRISADHVYYYNARIRDFLMKKKRHFSFKLNVDRSRFFVTLTYPKNWKSLSDETKGQIADEVALELAQHFTFMMKTWHEVLTFFGYKTMGIVPEFPSAFSWEDNYSNLLGIWVGTAAVQDPERDYDAAMTRLLRETLEDLGIQSAHTARAASEQMRGIWYEGNLFVNMLVRHTGIGLEDGTMTPLLVPGICEGAQPRVYPTPTLESFEGHGFTMTLKVEPREFERGQILRIVCPDGGCTRIALPDELPKIMEQIDRRANELGCEVVK